MDIAAGVMPWMRGAWPMVPACARISFTVSVDRFAILAEIHVGREAGFLVAQAFCDFFLLAVDIALVFGLDFHLFDYQRIGKPASTVVSLTCMLISAALTSGRRSSS